MNHAPPGPAPAPVGAAPTTGALFRAFLALGLMGFGGVLPLARHVLVEERRWLGADEFADLLGLCQFLPGGNVVNLSVAVGLRFRGVPGALAALAGLLAAPSVVVVLLGTVYDRFADHPEVRHAFAGLAAAAAGATCCGRIGIGVGGSGGQGRVAGGVCFFRSIRPGPAQSNVLPSRDGFEVAARWG